MQNPKVSPKAAGRSPGRRTSSRSASRALSVTGPARRSPLTKAPPSPADNSILLLVKYITHTPVCRPASRCKPAVLLLLSIFLARRLLLLIIMEGYWLVVRGAASPEGNSSCWRRVPSGMKGCCGRKNICPARGVWITPSPSAHSPAPRKHGAGGS